MRSGIKNSKVGLEVAFGTGHPQALDIFGPLVSSLFSVPDLKMLQVVHQDLQRWVLLSFGGNLCSPIPNLKTAQKNQPPDSEKQLLVKTSLQPEKNPHWSRTV